MEYGKTAYLKTEDLEIKLEQLSKQPKIKNVFTSFHERIEVKDGIKYEMCKIEGRGALTLTLKVSVNVLTPGTLQLLLDDAVVSEAAFPIAGENTEILINCVTKFGDGVLALAAKNGFIGKTKSLELSLIGLNAHIDKSTFDWAADSSGAECAVLVNNDGRLYILPGESGGYPSTDKSFFLGDSFSCDAVISGEKCYCVYSDTYLNVYGVCFDMHTHETAHKSIGYGAESLAVCEYKDELIVAQTKKGKMSVYKCDKNFHRLTAPVDIGVDADVKKVLFLKGAQVPSLIYYCGNKSYLKVLEEEICSKGAVVAQIMINVREM